MSEKEVKMKMGQPYVTRVFEKKLDTFVRSPEEIRLIYGQSDKARLLLYKCPYGRPGEYYDLYFDAGGKLVLLGTGVWSDVQAH